MSQSSARTRRAVLAAIVLLAATLEIAAAPGLPEMRTLANGLHVVLLEDHTLPQVAVSLWVRAGSKHEIESSAGYAHFLEHLLQRGTDSSAPYEYNRLSNRRGGAFSVRSNYDRTHITLTGVADTLGDLLEASASMAFHASLTDEQIDQELSTLTHEMRKYYDLPSSVAFLETMRYAFPDHPYRFAMLGNLQALGRLKSKPLTAFYGNLYVPNNMAIAIAGDFDSKAAFELVEDAFGKARRSAVEPSRPGPPTFFVGHDDFEKRLDLRRPWTTLSFVGPGYRHPDRPAFDVITQALADPGGSPIHGAMLRERAGSVAQISYYLLEDAGMLYLALNPATPELSYAAARAALQEIVTLRKHGVSEVDLRRHVDRILRNERLRAERLAHRVESLGEAALFGGVRYYWDLPEVYARLTPADIKRVAGTYLVAENLRLVVILPSATPRLAEKWSEAFHKSLTALGGLGEETDPTSALTLYETEDAARFSSDAWGDWSSAAGFAPPERTVLENGLTVIVLEDHRHSLVAVSVHLRAGAGNDPAGKEGLANLTLMALASGFTRQARAARPGDGSGSSLQPEVQLTRDLSELRFLVSPANLEIGLRAIGGTMGHSRISRGSLDDNRRRARRALDRATADRTSAGLDLLRTKVYAGHGYARPLLGTPGGLEAITPDDHIAFWKTHVRPSRAVLAVVGDVRPSEVLRLARASLGDWADPPSDEPPGQTPGAIAGDALEPTEVAAEGARTEQGGERSPDDSMPGGTGHAGPAPGNSKPGDPGRRDPVAGATAGAQPGEFSRLVRGPRSRVLIGVPAVPLLHDDFPALRLIGTALTLQAFEDLVFARRVAFSAVTVPEGLREGGLLALEIVTQHARRSEVTFDVQRLMRRLALEPLSAGDLKDLKKMQIGRGLTAAQGVGALASTLSYREAAGLGASSYRTDFVASDVTAEQLRDLARYYLNPEKWIVVKAGPASK